MSTLCSALTHSIQTLCPEIDAESLLPDYEILFDDNSAVIRIVENEPGGLGVIEAFTNEYLKDPRIYWNLVSETLGPCDGERIDQNLQIFL